MLNLRTSRHFDKDLKKIGLSAELIDVLHYLLSKKPLPKQYNDHPLTGQLKGCRDCHVKNDLVLIYEVSDEEVHLIRIGSHSQVFG